MDQHQDINPHLPHSAPIFTPQISSSAAFSNLVKRQVILSDKSTVAFGQFFQNWSPGERLSVCSPTSWKCFKLTSPERTEPCQKIDSCMRKLSCTAYRGLNMAEHLLGSLGPDPDTKNAAALVDKLLRGTSQSHRTILHPGCILCMCSLLFYFPTKRCSAHGRDVLTLADRKNLLASGRGAHLEVP
ncbi:hypothetical protein B0H11DRAFT_1017058 [Mycena galericulata]|nr:hypothetical protein B0H11DRAFT_1017058 [Mycena galericulata]